MTIVSAVGAFGMLNRGGKEVKYKSLSPEALCCVKRTKLQRFIRNRRQQKEQT